jgi:tetratricopeptide (TPR) repeat protein
MDTVKICVLLSLLVFSSCAEIKTVPEIKTAPVSDNGRDAENKTDSEIAQKISKEAWKYITVQSYKKAVDAYSVACSRYPQNPELRDGFIRTVEHIKGLADAAFLKEEFSSAGNIYGALLRSGIKQDIAAVLSFNKEFLIMQINKSAKVLTERGLNKYREGRLEDAIAIWKGIIEFDPDNKEVKNAINTTTVQLENLKRIN